MGPDRTVSRCQRGMGHGAGGGPGGGTGKWLYDCAGLALAEVEVGGG